MEVFKKWNELNQFHEVTKNLNYPRIHQCLKENDYTIPYGLKIKLHGTNAGVRVETDGRVVAQKRSSDLVAPNDNSGFRVWVEANESYFSSLARADSTLYIYGEWCGQGIQSNVACSLTPQKTFYVFSIDIITDTGSVTRLYDPLLIEERLGKLAPDAVIVIPWHVDTLPINFLEKEKTQNALTFLNAVVEEIGQKDPLIKHLFNIEGHGEGIVAYPLLGASKGSYQHGEEYFSWFNFKAKSEAHRVNKTKVAAQFDPERYASVQMFTDAYVTEARLLQAFDEAVQRRKDMRLTPDFLKWICQDIYKESTTEREASPDLDWKMVSKAISRRAVTWYKNLVMNDLEEVRS